MVLLCGKSKVQQSKLASKTALNECNNAGLKNYNKSSLMMKQWIFSPKISMKRVIKGCRLSLETACEWGSSVIDRRWSCSANDVWTWFDEHISISPESTSKSQSMLITVPAMALNKVAILRFWMPSLRWYSDANTCSWKDGGRADICVKIWRPFLIFWDFRGNLGDVVLLIKTLKEVKKHWAHYVFSSNWNQSNKLKY